MCGKLPLLALLRDSWTVSGYLLLAAASTHLQPTLPHVNALELSPFKSTWHCFVHPSALQLVRSNELVIEGGRHLLTEQLVDTFIPNDTHMAAGEARIQVRGGGGAA